MALLFPSLKFSPQGGTTFLFPRTLCSVPSWLACDPRPARHSILGIQRTERERKGNWSL